MTRNANHELRYRREGSTIFLALVMVMLVSILGVGLLRIAEENHAEAARRLSREQAFWAAEAGLAEAEAIAWENKELKNGTIAFPGAEPDFTLSGATRNGRYDVTVSRESEDPPHYRITSRGLSHGGVSNVVQMSMELAPALSMGLFGHTETLIDSGSSTHIGTDPPFIRNAYVGSNGRILEGVGGGSFTLRGKVLRGASRPDEIDPAENETRFEDQYVGYIDPDPLGITNQTGALHMAKHEAEWGGNPVVTNSSGQSLISTNGSDILLDVDIDAALPSGTYLFTDVRIRAGQRLTIGSDVTIFLQDGTFRMDTNARLGFPGVAREPFAIYSDTDESITLKCEDHFFGLVYAPYATVQMELEFDGTFRGVAWADSLSVDVSGGAFILLDLELQTYDYFKDYAYGLEVRDWSENGP